MMMNEAEKQARLESEALFRQDPVGFIRQEIQRAVQGELLHANEDGQARMAIDAFLRANPEAAPFMGYVLNEVSEIIQNDDDGVLAPWPELLQQGLQQFSGKIDAQMKGTQGGAVAPPVVMPQSPVVEQGKNSGTGAMAPQAFSRADIAKMSVDDYIKNEDAIRAAMKAGKIR